MKLEDDSYCFVCGKLNPVGLKLDFSFKNNKIFAEFTLQKIYQGYKDIVHGGIVGSILDEAMIHAVLAHSKHAITAEIAIRFKNPLQVGEKAFVEAEVIKSGNRLIEAEACIKGADSRIVAEGQGKFIILHKS